MVSHT